MADECEYLEYRALGDDSGDGSDEPETGEAEDRQPRAYCTAADQFVQAMRADVCNRHYGLDPETDCEIYRDHEGLPTVSDGEGAKVGRSRSDDASDPQADAGGD